MKKRTHCSFPMAFTFSTSSFRRLFSIQAWFSPFLLLICVCLAYIVPWGCCIFVSGYFASFSQFLFTFSLLLLGCFLARIRCLCYFFPRKVLLVPRKRHNPGTEWTQAWMLLVQIRNFLTQLTLIVNSVLYRGFDKSFPPRSTRRV